MVLKKAYDADAGASGEEVRTNLNLTEKEMWSAWTKNGPVST